MVRWHIAMIFGNIDYSEEDTQLIVSTLLKIKTLAQDKSVAIRTTVEKVLEVLNDEGKTIPSNWIKARELPN